MIGTLVDQELSVPSDVIQAGIEHLMENSAMIPLGQRQDSNFHISYISLNQVLEEKNKPNSKVLNWNSLPVSEGRCNCGSNWSPRGSLRLLTFWSKGGPPDAGGNGALPKTVSLQTRSLERKNWTSGITAFAKRIHFNSINPRLSILVPVVNYWQ